MNIIKIRNCNCIKEADISVESGALNIKYGINGTGKSTIGNAISIATTDGDIHKLRPYGIGEDDERQPKVERDLFDRYLRKTRKVPRIGGKLCARL